MATIPFIGPSYNLRRRHHSVQRAVNLVPVPLEPGNERTAWVFKDAPGLVAFGAIPDALRLDGTWMLDGSQELDALRNG